MFKTAGKLFSLFLLLLLSFIYTDKVFSSVKESDPIMMKVIGYKEKHDIEATEPIINGDELILGYSGIVVNKDESYKKMKEEDKFSEGKIVYENIYPKNTISKTFEYYIRQGNPSKKQIALIFKINDSTNLDKLLNLIAKTNVNVSFFLDGAWLENNVETAFSMVNLGCEIYNLGYDGKYTKTSISATNNLIESISLKDSLYCLNELKDSKQKDICTRKKMYSILPTLINPNFSELKNGLVKGAIVSYELSEYDINKFVLSVNAITNRGYNIVSLSKIISE